MTRLDKEEQEILDAFDAGKMQRSPDIEDRTARHQQYAQAMFRKDARINIRLSARKRVERIVKNVQRQAQGLVERSYLDAERREQYLEIIEERSRFLRVFDLG
jgi:predicted DNA binding CopG/RHH family protein